MSLVLKVPAPLTGIEVQYAIYHNWIIVRGIPEDGNSDTCLRLEGQLGYYDGYAWEALRGYDCMQHDDDFKIGTSYIGMRSRYCHAGVCSRPVNAGKAITSSKHGI